MLIKCYSVKTVSVSSDSFSMPILNLRVNPEHACDLFDLSFGLLIHCQVQRLWSSPLVKVSLLGGVMSSEWRHHGVPNCWDCISSFRHFAYILICDNTLTYVSGILYARAFWTRLFPSLKALTNTLTFKDGFINFRLLSIPQTTRYAWPNARSPDCPTLQLDTCKTLHIWQQWEYLSYPGATHSFGDWLLLSPLNHIHQIFRVFTFNLTQKPKRENEPCKYLFHWHTS